MAMELVSRLVWWFESLTSDIFSLDNVKQLNIKKVKLGLVKRKRESVNCNPLGQSVFVASTIFYSHNSTNLG